MSGGLLRECFYQLLDWVYPRSCEICGNAPLSEAAVCPTCLESLIRLPRPLCFTCGGVVSGSVADENACEACRNERWEFDFSRSALIYHAKLRDLILTFKYRRGIHLGETLADLMVPMWEEYGERLKGSSWTLVPVPVGRKKLISRGFNQAEELARTLSKRWGFPVMNALVRRNDAISQTALDRKGRKKHVMNLYRVAEFCRRKHLVEGKKILLIDDLFTTGSTANACATILKHELCASSVGVLTLARAVPYELIQESVKNGNKPLSD